jgi:hypothetical protein
MRSARAVLLVGSAKPPGTSTSESLGAYLFARLAERDVATSTLRVSGNCASPVDRRLMAALTDANLFVLATPIYVDSLPYLVTRTLESIAARRNRGNRGTRCAFAALVNCGFPEAAQCRTALDIAEAFARRAGFNWAGGLALGEGGAIDGKPLEALGWLTRHVRSGLDLTAAALADGAPIPAAAVEQLARPMMPARLYTMMANSGWILQAGRNGVLFSLNATPYDASPADPRRATVSSRRSV